ARDLAACVVQGALGATTVGGTLAVCRAAGIRFMGTGGTGGVHRGFAQTLDISSDLPQLACTAAVVVSSGAKSILDVPATAELLETLGVPVLPSRPPPRGWLWARRGGGWPAGARGRAQSAGSCQDRRAALAAERPVGVAPPPPAGPRRGP